MSILAGIVVHGIALGAVLAIAIPVKNAIDSGARKLIGAAEKGIKELSDKNSIEKDYMP